VGMETHNAVQQARFCGEDALVCVNGLALGTGENEVHIRVLFVVVESVRVSVSSHQEGKSSSILTRSYRWQECRRATWCLTWRWMLSLQSKSGMALKAKLEKDWRESGRRARARGKVAAGNSHRLLPSAVSE
jgi:hypothetical protein